MLAVDLKSRGVIFFLFWTESLAHQLGIVKLFQVVSQDTPLTTIIEPGNLEPERNFIPKMEKEGDFHPAALGSLGSYHQGFNRWHRTVQG